jgi:hypothetical protein
MSEYSFFDTFFSAIRARLRTAASNPLVFLWAGSIRQYRPASIICEARGRNGTRRMHGIERPRESSRDPQL